VQVEEERSRIPLRTTLDTEPNPTLPGDCTELDPAACS
jgi:hypothetical protein